MTNPFAGDATAVRGAITPLITPFTDAGELDLDSLPRLIEARSSSPSSRKGVTSGVIAPRTAEGSAANGLVTMAAPGDGMRA
ncbi:MAG TPA: hypothetical protein VGF68_07280, partial [Solirubrobacteraceae bacterium]